MLKTYLARIGNNKTVFPSAEQMTKAWIKYKKRLASKLAEPSLLQIRLYDLRHFKACMTYYRTKNVFFTKEQIGWKKLETALFYLQTLQLWF